MQPLQMQPLQPLLRHLRPLQMQPLLPHCQTVGMSLPLARVSLQLLLLLLYHPANQTTEEAAALPPADLPFPAE